MFNEKDYLETKAWNTILFICLIMAIVGLGMVGYKCVNMSKGLEKLQQQNSILDQQLKDMQSNKGDSIEGEYTLITNLSSSVYLNKIPARYGDIDRFEDVNGVKFFDVTENGIHYRYVEGHIQWPQLALYAPNMYLEVVSEKQGP